MTDDKGDAIYINISLTGWLSLVILILKSCFAKNRNIATNVIHDHVMKFLQSQEGESNKRVVIDVENVLNQVMASERKYYRCAKENCTNCICKKAGLACVPNKCHRLNNILCENNVLEV